MPVTLHFEFYGDVQLHRTLDRFAENVADARPAWEAIADRFAAVERQQFASQGRSSSGGWAPLSPRYGAWKARNYPGAKILHRDGDLEESLTRRPFGVEVILEDRMVIGSSVDYGAYHQRGGANLPRRRPIELTETERRLWVKVLQRFIVTGKAPVVGARGGMT